MPALSLTPTLCKKILSAVNLPFPSQVAKEVPLNQGVSYIVLTPELFVLNLPCLTFPNLVINRRECFIVIYHHRYPSKCHLSRDILSCSDTWTIWIEFSIAYHSQTLIPPKKCYLFQTDYKLFWHPNYLDWIYHCIPFRNQVSKEVPLIPGALCTVLTSELSGLHLPLPTIPKH